MAFDTRNPRLYLASRSPRRRELLTQMGILFDTLAFRSPPRQDDDVDETAHDGEAALVYVERVARLKAEHGWRTVEMRRLMPQLVLAADTTLEFRLIAPEPLILEMTEFTANDAAPENVGRVSLIKPGSSVTVSDIKGAHFKHPYVLVRAE